MIEVTDHALVRYIERVCGETLEPYRTELRALVQLPEAAEDVPDDGALIKIIVEAANKGRRRAVVTVLGPEQRVKNSARNRSIRRIISVRMPVEKPDPVEALFDA